jgi:hypothetical protein
MKDNIKSILLKKQKSEINMKASLALSLALIVFLIIYFVFT